MIIVKIETVSHRPEYSKYDSKNIEYKIRREKSFFHTFS